MESIIQNPEIEDLFNNKKIFNIDEYLQEIQPEKLNNSDHLENETFDFEKSNIKPFRYISVEEKDNKPERFAALQKWEGNVFELKENSFIATVADQNLKGNYENVEISYDEVSDYDKDLIEIGAYFYWSIGYLEKSSGQRFRSSIIKFKRFPLWTKEELNKAKKDANDYMKIFGIEHE